LQICNRKSAILNRQCTEMGPMRISRGKTALTASLFLVVTAALPAEPPTRPKGKAEGIPVPAVVEIPPPRVSPSPGLPGPEAGLPVVSPPASLPAEDLPPHPLPLSPAGRGVGGEGEMAPSGPRHHWWEFEVGHAAPPPGQGPAGAPPLGYVIGLHFRTQVENAVAARMTLYDYDFICGTEQLNMRGKDRLFQIALLLGHNTHPLVIQRTPHAPLLAEARRLAVLHALSQCPVPVPPERVVIGHPLAVPLQGWEAQAIYLNLVRTIVSGGAGARTTTTQSVGAATSTPTSTGS